ncbi:hypothetical protein TESG_08536 [Trichophyton tonsurans CBS 112818]|uniref:Uncharacterized protein n=1 Tax=Trichophyton tonsurans (strain CBS 112818) TaxID=647933 RepID=F2S3R5_TRIT1|nr:hypothetical protein TESG_08536 [Trichophyton tonsurans CBS 112818]
MIEDIFSGSCANYYFNSLGTRYILREKSPNAVSPKKGKGKEKEPTAATNGRNPLPVFDFITADTPIVTVSGKKRPATDLEIRREKSNLAIIVIEIADTFVAEAGFKGFNINVNEEPTNNNKASIVIAKQGVIGNYLRLNINGWSPGNDYKLMRGIPIFNYNSEGGVSSESVITEFAAR